jgi:hypothetical protein
MTLGHVGRRDVNILIKSNAPDSPHRLRMSADYRPVSSISATPIELRMGEIRSDDRNSFHLEINAFLLSLDSVEIEEVKTQNNKVDVIVNEKSTAQYANQLGYYRTKFGLEIVPQINEIGDFSDQITISFLPPYLNMIEVPVKGRVVSDWVLSPKEAVFVIRRENLGVVTRKVILKSTKSIDFLIQEVKNQFREYLEIIYCQTDSQIHIDLIFDSAKYFSDDRQLTKENIQFVIQGNDGAENQSVSIPIRVLLL